MIENKDASIVTKREHRVRTYLPGIALLVIYALVSWLVASIIPGLDQLLVAILVGFLLSNLVGIPDWASEGMASHKVLLGSAIVLMGASLSIGAITRNGPLVLLLTVCAISFTLVFVELISRNIFGVDRKLSALLAAGSGICGVSAVVAVAGSIRAREEHVVYATTTILLFDAITLVAYPTLGRILSIPSQTFGIWAGLSMFSTGPVIAAGFAHSETAGQWATLTKLTRNVFIGVLALGYATYYVRTRVDETGSDGDEESTALLQDLWKRFPKFIVGFIAVMLLASAGIFSQDQIQTIESAYNWLFLLAFVGLGAELSVTEFKRAGFQPILIVFLALCAVSALSLTVLSLIFG